MLVSDFDYQLPPGQIATHPVEPRDSAKMLVVDRATGALHDRNFRDLPDWLRPGDLLVLNNTRVFRARLIGHRAGHSGRVEALLTKRLASDSGQQTWLALVHPGQKIRVGARLVFGAESGGGPGHELEAEVLTHGTFGERTLRFNYPGEASGDDAFFAAVEKVGHIPLPPYLHRSDDAGDSATYQTIYAQHNGSAAAPTAGLHFTDAVFARLRERGILTAEITLHVGLGTFQPIRTGIVEEHRMHSESYIVSSETSAAITRTRASGGRVIAVGTTSVRTLEHSRGRAQSGECDLFIYGNYPFQVVDGILTNFHLPKSTLLMLACAFGGQAAILNAYRHAVERGYRFFSYGDCMLMI